MTTFAFHRGALVLAAAVALERAAPAYRALWWPRHDAANRARIQRVLPLIAARGDAAATAESRALARPWSTTPVRVKVAAYTNWAGAYTTAHPRHITIASTDADIDRVDAFEALFHEGLHTMDDSLFTVIVSSFHANGKRYLRDSTHPFIFCTAGETTRRLFPGHVPYAERVGPWSRNPDFARILPLLRKSWQPYLDGRGTLEDAVKPIAAAWSRSTLRVRQRERPRQSASIV